MSTIEEKRVYADRETPTPVYVAAEQGLVVARLSGDIVGEFSLARRETCRDVAAGAEALVVAGAEDVLVAPDGAPASLRETGFGPAVAVGLLAEGGQGTDLAEGGQGTDPAHAHIVAADDSGRVASLPVSVVDDDEATDGSTTPPNGTDAPAAPGSDWTTLGTVAEPRAVDSSLLAAADGVYRLSPESLTHSGLEDVHDVASAGAPLAAAEAALYDLGNGWMVAREGGHVVVDADERSAHAVTADGEVVGRIAGSWEPVAVPTDDPLVGFVYPGGSVVAATETGSLLVDAGDGWRSRALGVTGVEAVAVAGEPSR